MSKVTYAPGHKDVDKLEFDYITDGIYIGTNMCCQAHFDENLLKEGITEDISLEEEQVDTPIGVKSYLWLPVKDHTPPSPSQMDYGISALEKLVGLGKKIYVHCKNGHGRSPTLVAGYLIKTKGMTPDDTVTLIKKKRPSTHLEASQLKALENFSKLAS